MKNKKRLIFNRILIIFLLFLPSVARILNYNLNRIHGDDLLLAYYSDRYDLLNTNIFAPVPSVITDLENQLASLYFVFQKIFFLFFGKSLLSIKLSILPYVFGLTVLLYFIAKTLFNKQTALISVILYSFFNPSLYMETWGLNTISSVPVFLAFFYFLILSFKEKKVYQAVLSGIFCGFCYLFSPSSYVALPFLIFFSIIQFSYSRNFKILKNLLIANVVCLIILLPFLHYMFVNKNYYLNQRIGQVNLINGTWSSNPDRSKINEEIGASLVNSLRSLYQSGIAGQGGYEFGKQALFEPFTFVLFLAGIFLSIKLLAKKIDILYILLTIILCFIFGVVLTIQPPAFHRFILAFPFLALIMSVPFYFISRLEMKPFLKYMFTFTLLLVFIFSNEQQFIKITKKENSNTMLKVGKYINSKLPDHKIYMAAYPGFSFEKIYYFVPSVKTRKVYTDYHSTLLDNFNKNEKYVYVIIFPSFFNGKFQQKDSEGKIINFSSDYSVFYN